MKRLLFLFCLLPAVGFAQMHENDQADSLEKAVFKNHNFYEVSKLNPTPQKNKAKVKNIIFLIGDGMGTAQVYAALIANRGQLNLRQMPVSGFSKTNSIDNLITDSAAGATAFSTGKKTKNKAIGVDSSGTVLPTILEMAEKKGLATGMVTTCRITHATPAAFIAHQIHRNMYEEIATDFLNTDIDIFVGGGRDYFDKRTDGRNLLKELQNKGYEIATNVDSLKYTKKDKIACLVSPIDPEPYAKGRGEMLVPASQFVLNMLSKNEKGFFMMVEGSQIDWGGHQSNTSYIVTEMLDFDKTVGEALKFAEKDGETLVVVTADHETGGFSINGGSLKEGVVEGRFTTESHTAVMVPIFAYGPKAELFSGIHENTDFFYIFKELLGL